MGYSIDELETALKLVLDFRVARRGHVPKECPICEYDSPWHWGNCPYIEDDIVKDFTKKAKRKFRYKNKKGK